MQKSVLSLALLLSLSIFTPGCGNSTPSAPSTNPGTTTASGPTQDQINANCTEIAMLTSNSINIALSGYAAADPVAAKAVAAQIQTIVLGTLIPYLKGSGHTESDAINALLKQNFVTLPGIVASGISVAASILDHYLPVPGPNTFLSTAEVQYVTCFVQSVSDGAGLFIGGTKARADLKVQAAPGAWLNFTNKP